MLTFAAPFKKRTEVKELKFLNRLKQESKNWKIFEKKFGDLKIMLTFATPIQKRVSQEKQQVHWKDWKLYKQVPRKNTIYREALILLKGIMKCQRQA